MKGRVYRVRWGVQPSSYVGEIGEDVGNLTKADRYEVHLNLPGSSYPGFFYTEVEELTPDEEAAWRLG